ncbi:MAG: alpha/beta hydrolase [Chitinophagaceae bacterium]|nr:alpha/beta hydrolase [Chitinophagaceae bacterium]
MKLNLHHPIRFCWPLLLALYSLLPAIASSRPLYEEGYWHINGQQHYVCLRGQQADAPLLLWLHGGPGAAATAMLRHFNRELEQHFVVVYYEQRGAGRSYGRQPADTQLSVPIFIEDVHQLILQLQQRFGNRPLHLVGHSWGSRLGMYVARAYPELLASYTAIGQEVAAYEGELQSYQYTLLQAKQQGATQAVATLQAMGPPKNGHYLQMYAHGFSDLVQQKHWLLRLGGERFGRHHYRDWVWLMLRKTSIGAVIQWSKASASTAGRMFADPYFNDFDLRRDVAFVQVPVFFISGAADYNTPWPLVQQYYQQLQAPAKDWLLVAEAGHSPQFDRAAVVNEAIISWCKRWSSEAGRQ